MSLIAWFGVVVSAMLVGLWLYWQLVVAEGVYMGQRVVTWLYDLTAQRYDAIKQFDPEVEAIFLGRPIMEALRGQPAPFVLDVATGSGRLPRVVLEQPSFQGRIIALDASYEMLQVAVKHLAGAGGRVEFIWRDASQLPFLDDSFDLVCCLEMLEFTPHPQRQLQELCRVLQPGGLLVTTRRRGLDARLMPGKTHSVEQFAFMLQQMGLTGIRVEPWQVDYDLVWARRPGIKFRSVTTLSEVLVCNHCHRTSLVRDSHEVRCEHCNTSFPLRSGIINFRQQRR